VIRRLRDAQHNDFADERVRVNPLVADPASSGPHRVLAAAIAFIVHPLEG
jgi:hypothetical protein